MNKIKKISLFVCAFYAGLLIFDFGWIRVNGQTPQQSLTMVVYSNITAASALDNCDPTPNPCIDNRSQFTRQSSTSSYRATGTGTWSVEMDYADVTPTVWTSFGSTGVVTQASTSGIGYGIGPANTSKPYHDYIRFVITGAGASSVTILNYSGTRQLWWLPSVAALAFPITATQGGTSGAVYVDQFANSLSTACTNATNAGESLILTQNWNIATGFVCGAGAMVFTLGGKITPAASQTVTITPNISSGDYQQIFNVSASSSAIAFTGTAPTLNPNWFGADWTGTNESLPAFNAVKALTTSIHVPVGTYNFINAGNSSSWFLNLTTSGQALNCDPGASIEYTGTTNVDSVVEFGTSLTTPTNMRSSDCLFIGNGHVSYSVHFNSIAGGLFSHLQAYNTDSGHVCFYAAGGNTNQWDTPISSKYSTPSNIGPCATGFEANGEQNITINNIKMEGVTNGLLLTGSSGKNSVTGGTLESDTNGGTVSGGSGVTTLSGIDIEGNTSGTDCLVASSVVVILLNMTCGGGSSPFTAVLHIESGGTQTTVIGGAFGQITIDSGTVGTVIQNATFDEEGGETITDNGTCTVLHSNRDNNAGAFFEEKYGCGFYTSNDGTKIGIGAPQPSGAGIVIGASSGGSGSNPVTVYASQNGASTTQLWNSLSASCATPYAITATWTLADGSTPHVSSDTSYFLSLGSCSLQAGANTININGGGAIPIESHFNPGDNISTAYTTNAPWVPLVCNTMRCLDMSQ